MTTLRVGVSGCTSASLELVQRARVQHDCDVVAVHDDDAHALGAFASTADVGFAAPSFDALLGSGVDFVVLAGPANRLAQAQQAAAQSVPVLVLSPLANDLATATEFVTTCERAQVRCGVHVPDFEDPVIEQLRRMLANDWLGGVVAVQAITGDDAALRGGIAAAHHPLVEFASRQLHLARWLTGRRALRVTAQTTRAFAREDDSAVATAVLRGNIACTFHTSHTATVNAFAIHGTDGGVRIAGDRVWLLGQHEFRGDVFDYVGAGHELVLSRAELAGALDACAPRANLLGRFARWLEDTDDYPCPGDESLADFRAVDAMLRAARSGRAEDVS